MVGKKAFDVDALLASIATWRSGGVQLSALFVSAGVDEVSDTDLVASVCARLAEQPELVDAWQGYSSDKRWSPSPYLEGLEVGHYESGRHHVRRHSTPVEACADFVLAEVRWVVDRRVIEPS